VASAKYVCGSGCVEPLMEDMACGIWPVNGYSSEWQQNGVEERAKDCPPLTACLLRDEYAAVSRMSAFAV